MEPQGKKEVREAVVIALVTALIAEAVPRLFDYLRDRKAETGETPKKKRKRKK